MHESDPTTSLKGLQLGCSQGPATYIFKISLITNELLFLLHTHSCAHTYPQLNFELLTLFTLLRSTAAIDLGMFARRTNKWDNK